MTPLLLLALGCAGGSDSGSPGGSDSGSSAPTSGSLSVLTYNVHGLPSAITGDDTPARMADIAPLLPSFDLIGLQEDFDEDNHATLVAQADHPVQDWFDDKVSDDRAYGSGLALLAPGGAVDIEHHHYSACNGVLDGASDCLASKGFQRVRLDLGGAVIDVYNTHMEAGSGPDDHAAMAVHVDELLTAFAVSADHDVPVLFLGDTNLRDSEPDDLVQVQRLKDAGLRDACDEVGCAEPGRIDRVMLRDAGGITLTAESWQVAPGFFDGDGVPLSDHDPIVVQVGWSRE